MATSVAPERKQGGFIGLPLLLGAAGIAVIAAHIVRPNFAKIGALLGWGPNGPQIVQSAWNWSRKRGLPFAWVLATIIVESGGKPSSVGDTGGRSKGLMQVNTVAHARELSAAGLHPEDMHKIDPGIEWGTKVMQDIYDDVKKTLASHPVKTPKDVTLRLAYKGPTTVRHAIEHGQEPASIPWAPEAIVHWRAALIHVAQVV